MKQVRSYQTSDNQLFTDKTQAVGHQFKVDIKGLLQSNVRNAVALSPHEVANVLLTKCDDLDKLFKKFKRDMSNARRFSKVE